MLQNRSSIYKWGLALISTVVAANSQAGISVIVSEPPPPREIIVGPPGYTTCYIVPPRFYNNVWHNKQRVCEYGGARSLKMWIDGYWQCGSFRSGGRCISWHWVDSHWASRSDIEYYRRPSNRVHYRNENRGYPQVHAHEHENSPIHHHDNRPVHRHGNVQEPIHHHGGGNSHEHR